MKKGNLIMSIKREGKIIRKKIIVIGHLVEVEVEAEVKVIIKILKKS
jgi:hypothetical protein